ncbi:MAG TPA: DUF2062 domain-containing protein [Thermodesulfovibrionales bacterium]|jgi:uncharacterized protein (DUF2062 family)|nr:DUF2062 domain-containing protein [Thermodesulfovibrionales bacterium]
MKYFRKLKDYIVRLSKKGLSPDEIALGVAVGIFVAFIPLFGTHTIMAIALASLLRVNTLIVLLGTQISNPLTLPFQLFISAEVGSVILNGKFLEIKFSHELSYLLSHYLLPIIVGGLILGIVGSGLSYLLVKGFFYIKQNDTA